MFEYILIFFLGALCGGWVVARTANRTIDRLTEDLLSLERKVHNERR